VRQRGFTLIEVLVASIVGVLLATLAWPAYRGQLQRAGRSEAIEALQRLQLAQERHREMFGVYAAELRTLAIPTTTPGGRYRLALSAMGVESYHAQALASVDGPQQDDGTCTALSIEVRQGFATLGPDGRCWNR
jgi:type IV pilus assembly protein PilE